MLFPLLSTLKLAVILQQQTPTKATTKGGGGEIATLEEEEDNNGSGGEMGRIRGTTTATTLALTTLAGITPMIPLIGPIKKGDCWRRISTNQEKGGGDNGIGAFQMDCCSHSVAALPIHPVPASASPKCRLKLDFAQLLICIQRGGDFVPWHNAQQQCLGEMLAQIRRMLAEEEKGEEMEFTVSIGNWTGHSLITSELFNALRPLLDRIHSLELLLPATTNNNSTAIVALPNLGLFFPRLRHLLIHFFASNDDKMPRPALLGQTFLRDLPALKSLKVQNVDFGLDPKEEPQWLDQLERLHLENVTLGGELPRWMAKCTRLEKIFLVNCAIQSALPLSQLASAVQIKMTNNRIVDLHRVAFKCGRLVELDLRHNSISRIAPHSFSKCASLRFLDLSHNPFGPFMPDKPFLGCQRLKQLRLQQIGLSHLRPEMFVGLTNLKSLNMAGNPLARIDPFSFLPTRSIRSLSLANCSLGTIPLAVTQCCLLDSLSLDNNRLASRQSMPTEVLALLARLTHFSFQNNPLLQLPRGFFLYDSSGEMAERKLADILNTLIHLPVWRLEPCTPFLWHFHLRNATSPELRQRVAAWNEERMRKEQLGHCKQLYETILEGIAMYRELLENSGCEASRRLRSVRAKENCAAAVAVGGREKGGGEKMPKSRPTAATRGGAGIVQFLLAPASVILSPPGQSTKHPASSSASIRQPFSPSPSPSPIFSSSPTVPTSRPGYFGLLHFSLGTNFCLLSVAILLAAYKMAGGIIGKEKGLGRGLKMVEKPRRNEFEEIY